ncbi:Protein visC [Escherichia coli]|nr:Protein visC [Escherichia coli]
MQSVDVAIVGGAWWAGGCLRLTGERLTRCRTGAARTGTSGGGCTTTTARFGYQCRQRKITHPSWRLAGHSLRRACCYHGMEVWDKDSFGHISFDDQSMGYSHLGHIVENSVIHYALWNKAQQSSDITLLAPAELQQVAWGENETFLTLKDGSMLTARLVIGADGANSWLRNKADIPADFLGLSASRAGGDHSHGRTA